MKKSLWIGYGLTAILLAACGSPKNTASSESTDNGRMAIKRSNSAAQVRANMQADLPRIANSARAMGVTSQACPEGLSQACLDALFLALDNSRMIKSIATFAQTKVSVLQNGASRSVYSATASQPTFNAGFSLLQSTFDQKSLTMASPWSGGSGELFLSNQLPQAGIGLFVTLTNKSNLAGIAGGFAGADLTGWIEGAFYCYLENTTGTPTGACVTIPITSGGW